MGLLPLALALASPGTDQLFDGPTAAVCEDQRIGKAVAGLIGTWSQIYPFARVIIGADGQFGQVQAPMMIIQGQGYIICRASYRLSKAGKSASMMSYVTAITQFTFRVTPSDTGYTIALEDLPDHLEESATATAALIARFTINGRPYANVLRENQQRLNNTSGVKLVKVSPLPTGDRPAPARFSGAKIGVDYKTVRRQLLQLGYKPGQYSRRNCYEEGCETLPEIYSCSGTGMGYCSAYWLREDEVLNIVTTEGPGGAYRDTSRISRRGLATVLSQDGAQLLIR